ncbi:MAG: hypothetical protein JJU01_05840 [Alkalibacterium sp.]|nr:hypothetical protein [Alkalibacterium sp.]TVP90757.1 MAG: hypothetical protein EA249_06925 [Alkalibacterium sp.]
MNAKYEVFKERLVNANARQLKDLINQIEFLRQNGEISESERDNLKDIANRNLEAKGENAFGRLDE